MIELRLLGRGEHQAHAGAVEKCKLWRCLEQEGQAQNVAVEVNRARQVLYRDGDLADLRETWRNGRVDGHGSSRLTGRRTRP